MKNRTQKQSGFTLIELLVVVAIIGILAAIAIPQYAQYKKNSVDAKMKSDIHNAATAAEAYYGSNANTYASIDVNSLKTSGYRQSDTVTLAFTGAADDFTVNAASAGGNQSSFSFVASQGKIQ